MAGSYAKKASTPSKPSATTKANSAKRNTSILSFFQKTDSPQGATSRQPRMTQFLTQSQSPSSGRSTPALQRGRSLKNDTGDGLFLEDKKGLAKGRQNADTDSNDRVRSATPDDIWEDGNEPQGLGDSRFNEEESSVKRRKVSLPESAKESSETEKPAKPAPKKQSNGPFIDESDSEDDIDAYKELQETSPSAPVQPIQLSPINGDSAGDLPADLEQPPLVREATNHAEDYECTNFDDLEEDELVGEEFREGPWDQEDENGDEQVMKQEWETFDDINDTHEKTTDDDLQVSCPVCQHNLKGLSEIDASVHVNDCLDGNSQSTADVEPPIDPNPPLGDVSNTKSEPNKKLSRAEMASIARPAQCDPYAESKSENKTGNRSAFSKMMAGNAEDTAWATAAANEVSSRGKQAYQRTCPFYKIIAGFSICVDAFRYGAVEGCNAYFLSHFHSDHYIGLSKSWSHGPIYCSRATANLVRQQLRIDPKWLVDLDFETTSEVPNTGGVQVTMITANHCPGSSLFLFEKTFGSGPNARQERVLHCGDFRASPDQVRHPLLQPNPINEVTGKPRQQRIDKCYLDTTYLDPKYAFPSQDNVITACSDLCVRLNKEAGVGGEAVKTGAAARMSKYLSSITGSEQPQETSTTSGGRLLVVIGTYSIGKERICIGIARALGSKIFAIPYKQRICACLEDPELSSLLTDNPHEAQVHMQTLFELRADTLADYLDSMKPHFSRVVGFRPTGWTYRAPAGRMLVNPPVPTVLRGEHWRTPFTADNLTPQRGSTRESACYGVPYSEHSSFRELTMFCCALRIGKVIPTVNVGSQKRREEMKMWMDRWEGEKKRNGLFPVEEW